MSSEKSLGDWLRDSMDEQKCIDRLLQIRPELREDLVSLNKDRQMENAISFSNVIEACRVGLRAGVVDAAEILCDVAGIIGGSSSQMLDALPELVDLMERSGPRAKIAAIKAIATYGQYVSLDVVKKIASQILNETPEVQIASIRALPSFGLDKATTAIPSLTTIVETGASPEVRLAACVLFDYLGEETTGAAIKVLVNAACARSDPVVAKSAASALIGINPSTETLVAGIDSRDGRAQLIDVLREIGEKGRELRKKIEKYGSPPTQTFRSVADIANKLGESESTVKRRLATFGIRKNNNEYKISAEQWEQLVSSFD